MAKLMLSKASIFSQHDTTALQAILDHGGDDAIGGKHALPGKLSPVTEPSSESYKGIIRLVDGELQHLTSTVGVQYRGEAEGVVI